MITHAQLTHLKTMKRNHKKLIKLIPELTCFRAGMHSVSQREGTMDLKLDCLGKTKKHLLIALSHYYKHPSGDLIADPDMELRVYREHPFVEALTFQNAFIFNRVYDKKNKYNRRNPHSMNHFLGTWLNKCIQDGHRLIGVPQEGECGELS